MLDGEERSDADLLTQGADRATLMERVSAARWSIRKYVRRHWLKVGVAAGTVIAVAADTAYAVTRPPEVDPVIHLTVVGVLTHPEDLGGGEELNPEPGVLQGVYTVRSDVVGDEVQVLGVGGPGLRDPAGSPLPTTAEKPVNVTVSATVDCSAAGWWSAEESDYTLLLRRTDGYGRVVDHGAPLGQAAAAWRDAVCSSYLRVAVAGMTVADGVADASPGRQVAEVTVSVRNPNPFPIWIEAADVGYGSEAAKQIPAEGSTELHLPMLVTDCSEPRPRGPLYEEDATGAWYIPARADMEPLETAPGDGFDDPESVGLPVDAGLAARIVRQLSETCHGAPDVRATVAGIHRTGSAGSRLRWAIDVRLSLAADQVAFGVRQIDPEDPIDRPAYSWEDSVLEVSPPVSVHGGVAHATLKWTADCTNATGTGPPGFFVVAVDGDRRYPRWLTLDDRALLAALRASCHGSPTAQEALDSGWPESST